ncbi:MAG: hypothetical protein ACLGI7_12960, partial [Gammaproteobacteria bacterium]
MRSNKRTRLLTAAGLGLALLLGLAAWPGRGDSDAFRAALTAAVQALGDDPRAAAIGSFYAARDHEAYWTREPGGWFGDTDAGTDAADVLIELLRSADR